jgi:hypothetical protein
MNLGQPLELTLDHLKDYLNSHIGGKRLAIFTPPQINLPSADQLKSSVLQSGRLSSEILDEAIVIFYSLIESAWANPLVKYLISTDIAYSLETCTDLFIEGFTNSEKARLGPIVKIPPREACAQLMKDYIIKLPWKYQDITQSTRLSNQGTLYVFESFDERGNLEKRMEFLQLEEAYWAVFNSVVGLEYILNSFNQTFDASKYFRR